MVGERDWEASVEPEELARRYGEEPCPEAWEVARAFARELELAYTKVGLASSLFVSGVQVAMLRPGAKWPGGWLERPPARRAFAVHVPSGAEMEIHVACWTDIVELWLKPFHERLLEHAKGPPFMFMVRVVRGPTRYALKKRSRR